MFPQGYQEFPDALLAVDASGSIVFANRQAELMFGYPPEGLSGLPVEQLMPEGLRARHRGHRAGYSANPQLRPMGGSTLSLIGQRLDGEQFPVEIGLSPVQSSEGLRYLASVRDVSDTQFARQKIRRGRFDDLVARFGRMALESADESRMIAEMPAVVANALGIESVAIAFLRADQDVIDIGAAVGVGIGARHLKLTRSSAAPWKAFIEGQPVIIQDLAVTPIKGLEWPISKSSAGCLAIMPLAAPSRALGAVIAHDAEPGRFDHDAQHLLRSMADLLAAMLLRRRTEEQLAHAQRLDALGQLTGGIAHDFNNLLTVISGNLQLLEMGFGEQSGAAELIASALRSAARGSELTAKLLAFARRQRLSPRSIQPAVLLRGFESMLKGTLEESIKLRIECENDLPPVYADAAQLETALLNLVLNARDAMPRGGDVSVTAGESWVSAIQASSELAIGHYVTFTVIDTGRGMTERTLARATEPFFTTKPIGSGTGLGLSMVHGFAKQSGGHLHMVSRLGYGTRAVLYLPVAKSIDTPQEATPPELASGNGEHVLLVEDDTEVRNVASAFLHSLGYRVTVTADASDALRQVREDPSIALLFSDVMLGVGMNGNELAGAARAIRPDIAILLSSGYEDKIETAEAGNSFELLRKPYQREHLGLAIRRQIDSDSN